MKPFRGIRLFFYNLSAAGPAMILTTVLGAGISFFHPSLAALKNGLPRYLPAFLFGSLPPIAAVVLPSASSRSVIDRTSGPRPAISEIPPALSATGP